MHPKEGKPRTIRELGRVAENYVEAHATDIVFEIEPRQHRIRSLQSDICRCHICGETGHIRNQCPRRSPDPKPPSPPDLRGYHHRGHRQIRDNNGRPSSRSQKCSLCNKPGHIARNCLKASRCRLTPHTSAVRIDYFCSRLPVDYLSTSRLIVDYFSYNTRITLQRCR